LMQNRLRSNLSYIYARGMAGEAIQRFGIGVSSTALALQQATTKMLQYRILATAAPSP
jgi:hypothetical protein